MFGNIDLVKRKPMSMPEINKENDVYLFLHGRMDLKQKAIESLVTNGVSNDKIILALPNKVGKEGDYMAMLWMPPNPDHIKIQKITKIEKVKPEGMIGLWKGVAKDDLFTIPL
jgi:predicted metalloprotease